MTDRSYLTFSLHNALYGFETNLVREVTRIPELTSVKTLPSYFAGVVNHRGQIVPVIDFGKRLGHPRRRYQIRDQIIVFECTSLTTGLFKDNTLVMGLIVNEIQDVYTIPTHHIEAVPSSEIGIDPSLRFVSHVAKLETGLVMLLDPAALIREHELVTELIEDGDASPLPSDHDHAQPEVIPEEHDNDYFFPEATLAERKILRERATHLMQVAEYEDVSGYTPVAVVRLNQEYFGIDIAVIREFAEIRDIVPIPCCPEFIVGNMNLRGDVLTLIDIRTVLKMSGGVAIPPNVIVARVEKLVVGILVDEVVDSIHLNPRNIKPIPSTLKEMSEGYLKGTALYRERMLSLLDLPVLLMSGELTIDEPM